jgi:glutamine synthetase
MDAITALRGSELYRSTMGAPFIDYLLTIKEAEVARFLAAVTDWEQREYFSLY